MRTKIAALALAAGAGTAAADDVTPAGVRPGRAPAAPPVVCAPLYGPVPGTPNYGPAPYAPAPGTAPAAPGTTPTPGTAPGADPGTAPPPAPDSAGATDALTSPFAQQTAGGGEPIRSAVPTMYGDFGGTQYRRFETVGTRTVVTQVGTTPRVTGFTETVSLDPQTRAKVVTRTPIIVNDPVFRTDTVEDRREVRLQLAGRYNGFKVTENDTPRPTDRVYFGYNYFDRLARSSNPGLGAVDGHRETFGFEKTLLDGYASVGMRLPFVQIEGPGTIAAREVGDLSLSFKYAFVNDARTGDVLSAGLILTVPTGSGGARLSDGTDAPHSTLFQPWVGGIRAFDRFYTQAFSSVVVPTDDRDPVILFNSISAGYWVYRGAPGDFLMGLVPVAEVHVSTPLNQRDPDGRTYVPDQVNLTTGVHFLLPRTSVGTAVCVPLAGPRPWALEAIFQVNLRF